MIYEKGLEKGAYLSIWMETSNIIPMHKKNSRQCKKNYRPILLWPIFGEFLKNSYLNVYCHLCYNDILTPYHCTNLVFALVTQQPTNCFLYHTNSSQLLKRYQPKKLEKFSLNERVWHEGLLYKLECCGISGNLLSLVSKFLTNRGQRVVLDGKNSDWRRISAEVYQCSVLGPLFLSVSMTLLKI